MKGRNPGGGALSFEQAGLKKAVSKKIFGLPSLADPFGNIRIFRQIVTALIGFGTYIQLNILCRLKVKRAEILQELPSENVLFISNHQSYYVDVIGLYHIFSASKWGLKNINLPIYLLFPKVRAYYIAAEETMKARGLLLRLFTYAGAVTVKRSWRHNGEEVYRSSDLRAPAKIKKALADGWVINFPQGTTSPDAPIRRGSANIIRVLRPLVVPVRLSGFVDAFGKKGLFPKKRGKLNIDFLDPIQFGQDTPVEEIYAFLEDHIFGEKPSE